MLNTIQKFWKNYSCLLVYTALALLAVSDTGYYFYMADYVGAHAFLLRQVCVALLTLKIVGTRYTAKEFLLLAAIFIPALYNYSLCGNITFIYSILVIAAIKDIDLGTLFKILFFATFSSLLTFGVLSYLGIGDVVALTENFGRGGIETRYCWGMHHPNIWHFAFARVIIYFVLGFKKQLKWYAYLLLLLLNYTAYCFTASRTGLLATSAFLLMILACRYLEKIMYSVYMKIALIGGTAAGYGLFIYIMNALLTKPNTALQIIDQKLTTGRLRFAGIYFSEHPIRFWGSDFYYGTVVDCGFLRLFYDAGWLLAGIFFIAFFVLLHLALKQKNGAVVSTCIFMFFYSIYEIDPVTRPTFNVVIFFMAALIYGTDYLKRSVD